MQRVTRSLLSRYGAAVASTVLATIARLALNPILEDRIPYATYFLAVMFTAWYGGFGPAILAIALGGLTAFYFFVPPQDSLLIQNWADFVGLVIYVIVGGVGAIISEVMHREARRADRSALALRDNQEWLSTTLNSIGDAVIATDSDAQVVLINGVAQKLTGWSQDEALGQPLEKVFNIINENTRAPIEEPVTKVLQAGAIVGFANHTLLITRDGAEVPIDNSGATIRDAKGKITGVVLVFRDISERKRADAAVQKWEQVFWLASWGVVIADPVDNTLKAVNPAYAAMHGYSVEELIGKSIAETIAPEARDRWSDRVRVTHELGHNVYESLHVRKDGTRFPVLMDVTAVKDSSGKVLYRAANLQDITRRKEAEAERERLLDVLDEQRRRLDSIVSSVPGVVWEAWGQPDEASQRINFVSDYVETMLGYTVQQWLAEPNFWLSIVHPDDKERAALESYDIFAGGKGGTSEFRWIRKDGRALSVEAQSIVVCDEAGNPIGMRGVTIDITERKQVEEAQRFLAEASQLLSSSLDYEVTLASVARLVVPRLADWCSVHIVEQGQIRQLAVVHVDPAKVEWVQELQHRFPPDPHATTGVPNVVRTGEAEFYPEITESTLSSAARDAEQLEILRQLGLKSAMIVPLVARGRTLGAISIVAAESGRTFTLNDVALAEQLASRAAQAVDNARLYREAKAARDEAEAANCAKDEFLATVSHELRTPLNAILGWSHMLRRSTFDAETSARALETIERNAKSQAQLIEDILDVSRIITGKLRLDVRSVELASVVEAAIDSVQPAAEAKGIRIQSVLDPRAGPISGDPERLQQVVWNLLSNAVKFTPRGGRVQIRLERVNSHVEIIVSDTGIGITAEFLPHVFDRFRQADSTSTRLHGGLGLGLAIVRHLVEMHGGSVNARSAGEGQGATFVVNLPIMVAQPAAENPARIHPSADRVLEAGDLPTLSGLRLLVVDDESDTRNMLTIILKQFGAEVRACSSVSEALEAIEQWKPAVLVSDIEMPGADGYELIRRLRTMGPERGGNTPAVALTAYARIEDRMRALSAGYHMHISKPVEPAELAVVIASLAARPENT